MKRFAALSVLIAATLILQAHEFWMAPSKYYYAVGEQLSLDFRVGEDFIGEAWGVKPERFERFELHQIQKSQDLKSLLQAGDPKAISTPLLAEGSNIIVMQSNHAFSELDGEKFNAYLKEDALDEAYSFRRKNNQLDKPGKELYAVLQDDRPGWK